ncbi:hypothetical protein GLS40_04050 [Pseudooceanicola sp. 216_PA32_1]|uniref:Uncharacterized protein n=1 Tax=Pseudooceanicola pacificus TaxID=2676438 RepID=A0A844WE41_9RHOB|nr:hypothetical protein [Pseudooceanicola pacificus]MWB77189.1 hypothetical protein [Pseudooceanicola pacificus]
MIAIRIIGGCAIGVRLRTVRAAGLVGIAQVTDLLSKSCLHAIAAVQRKSHTVPSVS